MNELQMCKITEPKNLEYKKVFKDGLNKQKKFIGWKVILVRWQFLTM